MSHTSLQAAPGNEKGGKGGGGEAYLWTLTGDLPSSFPLLDIFNLDVVRGSQWQSDTTRDKKDSLLTIPERLTSFCLLLAPSQRYPWELNLLYWYSIAIVDQVLFTSHYVQYLFGRREEVVLDDLNTKLTNSPPPPSLSDGAVLGVKKVFHPQTLTQKYCTTKSVE